MKAKTYVLTLLNMLLLMPAGYAVEKSVGVYTRLDRPVVLAGGRQNVVVEVALIGRDVEAVVPSTRMPFNVAIVLDKSGSMQGQDKIENAKKGAIEIIERLNSKDAVSLIVYDDVPRVVIPARTLENKQEFIRAINNIQADGSTALYGGLELGFKQIAEFSSSNYLNRIFLLSDGLANVGPSSTQEIRALAKRINNQDISISTVGVGLDYNEDLMTALSSESGGNCYFASKSEELPGMFAQEIDEAVTLVAQKVKIELRTAKGVKALGLIGRDGETSADFVKAIIPNVYSKNEKYALMEFEVPAGGDGEVLEVASVKISYINSRTQKEESAEYPLQVRYDKSEQKVADAVSMDILKDVALTRTADLKRQVVDLADRGSVSEARSLLSQNAEYLERIAKLCNNDQKIFAAADENRRLAKEMDYDKGLSKYNRKRVTNDSWIQSTQQYEPYYSGSQKSSYGR